MKFLTRINLVLVIIANIFVLWTWVDIFYSVSDDMFGAMFFLPLLFFTFYYFILMGISINSIRNVGNQDISFVKNVLLLLFITIPVIVIYFLST